MEQHDFLQGSIEWHQHRATHFNASDAPAMLGISQYKTRNQLLHEMATGITPEIDAATQRRFDAGHRFEALARPLAEQIIGKKLYPVIGSEGNLSASFDGLTADDSAAFEHKSLNNGLREALSAGEIPEQYRAQMEQQLMVSGATKCLFMASKFDGSDALIEELHCWYESDQAMRDNIMQGWTRFAIDLAAYVPPEAVDKAIAAPIMKLPALFIQVEGKFNLTTNLDAFGLALKEFVEKIDLKPVDDQGFADLDAQVKCLKEAEALIKAQKLGAQGQVVSFDAMCKTADLLLEVASKARIAGENAVRSQKVAIKDKAIAEAKVLFAEHVAGLEAEIAPIRLVVAQPDFITATKGLKGLKSLHNEIDTALANAKIAADAVAKDVRAKLVIYSGTAACGYEFLFRDLQTLIAKPKEDFELVISTRVKSYIDGENAKREAERARIQQEEEAKAKAAAQKTIDETERNARIKAAGEFQAIKAAEADKAEQEAAADIEEKRKQAQLAAQAQPFKLSGAKTVVAQAITTRPSDKDIIAAISEKFGVSTGKACDWIFEVAEAMRQAANFLTNKRSRKEYQ